LLWKEDCRQQSAYKEELLPWKEDCRQQSAYKQELLPWKEDCRQQSAYKEELLPRKESCGRSTPKRKNYCRGGTPLPFPHLSRALLKNK